MNLFITKSASAAVSDSHDPERQLKRSLNAWDLSIMGVSVAVGAGIFSVGAQATSEYAGPSVIVSFVLAAVVCGLAMMNYAEMASTIPVAGSAYTFSYVSMGELVAWIIGWDLILEMLMAAAVISKYWGIYLQQLFEFLGVSIPLTTQAGGWTITWAPAFIVGVFTVLLMIGTRLTNRVNSVFTILKVSIVIFVVIAGAFFVKGRNFHPFFPPAEPIHSSTSVLQQSLFSFMSGADPTRYGVYGMLGAAALVFFAFIGFDVVATAAEETKNPQKNLPRGILGGLGIVTVLYIAVIVVVAGMVSYREMADVVAKSNGTVSPSLALAFKMVGANWAGTVITLGIVVGLTSVIMVLLLGLTRVVFTMSRDGLLPRSFSKTSRRRTPARLQLVMGVLVAAIAALTDVGVLSEMINIGTLSAFVLVSFAVPVLRRRAPGLRRGFRVPFSPWLPLVSGLACIWLMLNLAIETWLRFVVWLIIGMIIYAAYSYRHSRVRLAAAGALSAVPAAAQPDEDEREDALRPGI
jgi:APA family basic amino acid/polyamine antiporter